MSGRYPNEMIVDHEFKLTGGQFSAALEVINDDIEDKDKRIVSGASAMRKHQNNLS